MEVGHGKSEKEGQKGKKVGHGEGDNGGQEVGHGEDKEGYQQRGHDRVEK